MTAPTEPRRPRAFSLDDPTVVRHADRTEPPDADGTPPEPAPQQGGIGLPSAAEIGAGFRWGQLLVAAAAALAALAAGLWFTRFVSIALARDDAVGWIARGLAAVIAVAGLVLIVRELVGMLRLARLGSLRRDGEAALAARDTRLERQIAVRLSRLFAARPEQRWGRARLADHLNDVRDPGDLLRLADRELLAPLDREARSLILASAKRVGMVTAISPMAALAVLFVLIENLRLLRKLAGLYGGRPGFVGGLRLARMVIGHIIASGGLALTDDLIGQFLGQDVLRRVSRRLGEGAFNGALTARVGVAAIEVIRPLPYLDAQPIRLRDVVAEVLRRRPTETRSGP